MHQRNRSAATPVGAALLASLVVWVVFSCLSGCVSEEHRLKPGPDEPTNIEPAPDIDVQAHRGGRDRRPENTLAAFAWAMDLGVTTLEADLAVTADDIVVISHDPYLSTKLVRNSAGEYVAEEPQLLIKDLTLSELQRYDVGQLNPRDSYANKHSDQTPVPGQHIPTLAELFELARATDPDIRFNIEIKTYPPYPEYTINYREFARLVVETIDRYGMREQVTVQSFDWRSLAAVRELAPEIGIVCLAVRNFSLHGVSYNLQAGAPGPSPWLAGLDYDDYESVPKLVVAFGADTYSPYYREINRRDVEEAHELGLKVVPWTANSSADMLLLLDYGVDGIISDRPDTLLNLVHAQ